MLVFLHLPLNLLDLPLFVLLHELLEVLNLVHGQVLVQRADLPRVRLLRVREGLPQASKLFVHLLLHPNGLNRLVELAPLRFILRLKLLNRAIQVAQVAGGRTSTPRAAAPAAGSGSPAPQFS